MVSLDESKSARLFKRCWAVKPALKVIRIVVVQQIPNLLALVRFQHNLLSHSVGSIPIARLQ